MVSWKGFEPLTDGLEGRCSILLSYQDICSIKEQINYTTLFKSFQ